MSSGLVGRLNAAAEYIATHPEYIAKQDAIASEELAGLLTEAAKALLQVKHIILELSTE